MTIPVIKIDLHLLQSILKTMIRDWEDNKEYDNSVGYGKDLDAITLFYAKEILKK